ncbi:2,3-bisphosphoglycerate-independent phosphoglycerate mutase [Arenibacter antarcticus]|uniref:Alkaline phosphatase family protein n=1 Tax=Arenibacter antarcticus TaxID=2040469 RepID=A0ABW5VAW5_9FLAO|nr:alkaline phosphatase family protein [Arenibacter sp. H213]MCM4167764.1 phosphoglyceromutase [Arenibacter sp. H213]
MKRSVVTLLMVLLVGISSKTMAQTDNQPNVILITLDGLRWQELFSGADPQLVANKDFVGDTTGLKSQFWRDTPEERRAVLMPFFWNQVQSMGQLHGNRNVGSKVNLTNKMWFSYPGYNEILTGEADDIRITSNRKTDNPNETILERVNKLPAYKGKVAAFGSWDVFPFIVNKTRSGVPVNAGFGIAVGNDLTEREVFLNQLQSEIPSPWGSVRLDAFTNHYAMEYMKRKHPKLVFIAYGETDDFAHDGEYDAYLESAQNTDGLIEKLWEFTQQDPFYKDNTTFIITTDHGRGTMPLNTWKGHGDEVKGSDQVWMVAFGKGVSAKGEVAKEEQLYTDQIAPTVIKNLGVTLEGPSFKGKALSLKQK